MPTTPLRSRSRLGALVAALGVSALLLTACGGSAADDQGDQAGAPAPESTAAASPNGRGGSPQGDGGRGEGFGQQFQAIRECLTAAGLPVPTFDRPSGMVRPSGMTGRPTGWPSGVRPSGRPSGMGSGMGRDNPFAKLLSDPAAQQALQACGISLPTGRPGGGAGGPGGDQGSDQGGPTPTD